MASTNVRALRYAEAAFEVARQDEQIDTWIATLERAVDLYTVPEAQHFLTSPVLSPSRKIAAMNRLLPDLPQKVGNFLALLARRGRLDLLPEVLSQFRRLVNEYRGIVVAEVTTAVPIDTAQRDVIAARLAQRVGTRVTVQTRVDPAILGGVVARIGDNVIDGSVRGRLERLRQRLMA